MTAASPICNVDVTRPSAATSCQRVWPCEPMSSACAGGRNATPAEFRCARGQCELLTERKVEPRDPVHRAVRGAACCEDRFAQRALERAVRVCHKLPARRCARPFEADEHCIDPVRRGARHQPDHQHALPLLYAFRAYRSPRASTLPSRSRRFRCARTLQPAAPCSFWSTSL